MEASETLSLVPQEKLKSLIMSEIKEDMTYEDYVILGKSLLKGKEVIQAKIAFYACQICQIRHGGQSAKYYTLTDYADDLGLPRKTLQSWTLTYRNVIMKLDIPIDSITAEQWRNANRVNDNITWRNREDNRLNGTNRRATKYKREIPADQIRVMYDEEKGDKPSLESESRIWATYLRQLKNNILKRDLSLGNENTFIEIMEMCDTVSDYINHELSKNKKKKIKTYKG